MDDTMRVTKEGIRLYDTSDFAGMHGAGRLAAEILDSIAPMVRPGATTAELDGCDRGDGG